MYYREVDWKFDHPDLVVLFHLVCDTDRGGH